jgi:hypothetical protein
MNFGRWRMTSHATRRERRSSRAEEAPGKFAVPTSGKGKSGGYRVLYAVLPAYGTVLLIAAWPKAEREDLEPDDYKAIGKIIARIQKLLDQGRIV